MSTSTDTIVIGAGQAGLAVSDLLRRRAIPHVVLERGRVGESWRSQRWDSFHINTPNRYSALGKDAFVGDDPDGFCSRDELLEYFDGYSKSHRLPILEGVEVSSVRPVGDGFAVETPVRVYRCRNVVMCSGDQNRPFTPSVAADLPDDVVQLHVADYRSPEQLPAGATLVVGSGQSGVQIVEELLEAGRSVYLCTSKVGRAPRRYRGKDIFTWLQLSGMGSQRPGELADPNEIHARQPQVSGTRGGHSVSLQALGRRGVQLLGRLQAIRGRTVEIGGDLVDSHRPESPTPE